MDSEEDNLILKSDNEVNDNGKSGAPQIIKVTKRKPGGDIYNVCCIIYDEYNKLMRQSKLRRNVYDAVVEHPLHHQNIHKSSASNAPTFSNLQIDG